MELQRGLCEKGRNYSREGAEIWFLSERSDRTKACISQCLQGQLSMM